MAIASLTAIILSGCGGGDGSASSTDAAQTSGESSDFRSFVSVNPQVMAAIEAEPVAAGPLDTKADGSEQQAAERAAGDDPSQDGGTSASFVDTMISDMTEMNDLGLKDVNRKYGWARGPGYVMLGNNTRGSKYVLPWFVQFEGEGNAARNTRIQMRDLRVFVKSRSSGEWKKLSDSDSFGGVQCAQGANYFQCPASADVRPDAEGASTLPLSGRNLHGWWGGRKPVDHWDIAAVVVTLQSRLIADPQSGVDDRSKAKYLVHVGADYYPENARSYVSLPPAGISRAKLLTNDWQTITMSTLRDAGFQEPGGGISSAELRAAPPPM